MKLHEIKSPLLHPESEPEDETPLREHPTDQQKNPTHPFKTDLLFICSQYIFVILPPSPQTSLFYWKLNELQAFIYLIQFHVKFK